MHPSITLQLLTVVAALILVFSSVTVTADESPTSAELHRCGFDRLRQYHNVTPTGITLKHQDPTTGATIYEGVSRSRSGTTYKPIRIAAFFNDLDNPSKYCTSASGTSPDFQGGAVLCNSESVLTSAKKEILKTTLIAEALQLHIDRLRVERLISPVVVPSSMNYICESFSIPSSHRTRGVSGYDFVIYVAAVPTWSGAAAWATTCASLTDSDGKMGRPVVGVLNISPAYISTSRTAARAVAHEILHALGFSQETFVAAGMYNTTTVRQKTGVPVLTSPNVVSAAQSHYGCPSLANMELEDIVYSDAAGLHWKRRNAKDELMASVLSSQAYYTAMTIAAMEDLGYYQGDYTKAETMQWGLNAGCKLMTDMCMNDSVPLIPSMFCTPNSNDLHGNADDNYLCTSDRGAVGTCNTYGLGYPDWESNYGFYSSDARMDFCPFIDDYLNGNCVSGNVNMLPDSKFSDSSRCLDVSAGKAVCAAIKCRGSTYTVKFKSGNAVACTPGTTVKIPKTNRTATCPPYIEVCDPFSGAFVTMATSCSGVLLVLLGALASILM